MASNLAETLMFPLRPLYPTNFDKNERRTPVTGAMEIFEKQNNDPLTLLTPDVRDKIKNSFNNTVQIPVINYEDVIISDIRSCEFCTEGNESKIISLTSFVVSFCIYMATDQHKNNEIKKEAQFNAQLTARLQALRDWLDLQKILKLEQNKNQYWPQELLDYYPEIGDAFQVTQAEKNDLYNNMTAAMKTMNFMGNPDVLVNPIGMPIVNRLMNQGSQNGINESFQLGAYREWHASNNVVNGDPTIQSTGYVITPGTVATESFVDPSCEAGIDLGNKSWSVARNVPLANIDMGLFYQADCSDISADQAGLELSTRSHVESYEWSANVMDLVVYNSDPLTRYNPILKFEVSQL